MYIHPDQVSKTDLSSETDERMDSRFSKWLIKNVGVLFLPLGLFLNEDSGRAMETCVRVCFFKQNAILEKVVIALRKWTSK